MTEKTAKDFIGALHKLEANRDLDTICGLFNEDCEIGNVVTEDKNIGVREFWTSYRDSFDRVQSTFRNEIVSDATVALEWKTTGTNSKGHELEYEGISILETKGDKITRFHAYFDANKLGKQMVE
ncbi:MAG TPA: nuclear transport factor 2 family protein [Pyrinomonadaceae bacterium]|nr:nuclear transport factor 2 family protein [Pyrinomonadaceae bacterium]